MRDVWSDNLVVDDVRPTLTLYHVQEQNRELYDPYKKKEWTEGNKDIIHPRKEEKKRGSIVVVGRTACHVTALQKDRKQELCISNKTTTERAERSEARETEQRDRD